MSFQSQNRYHDDPWGRRRSTDWRRIDKNRIAIADSIAYPEGGGEAPDVGSAIQGDRVATFADVQRIDGEVRIRIDTPLNSDWDESSPIDVEVDIEHRARKARSHTAAHLLFIAFQEVLGVDRECEATGWSVEADGGRFEIVGKDISGDDLVKLQAIVDEWRAGEHVIEMSNDVANPERRVWHCREFKIPCGGNHVPNTSLVGELSLRRKKKGKARTRIYWKIADPLSTELIEMFGRSVANERRL